MNHHFLRSRLDRVAGRVRWLAVWRTLAACWAGGALLAVGVAGAGRITGGLPDFAPAFVLLATGLTSAVLILRALVRRTDYRALALRIERRFPDLDGVLITAVQRTSEPGLEPGYLEQRLLREATARSQERDWREVVPRFRVWSWVLLQSAAAVMFTFSLGGLRVKPVLGEKPAWVSREGVAVTPGDTAIEKGESLVVLARFSGALPTGVNLVVRSSGAAPRMIPLVKSLADPVFGGSVTEVASDLVYHLEYRAERTREFKVTVFEHPRLERADVVLTYPEYTRLPPKRIEDTRRVSAVEGTRLDFNLQLNKPVKTARLVARGEGAETLELKVDSTRAVASLEGFTPAKSATYELRLVDAEDRANKVAAAFVVDVQPNRAPEIRLALPRGDIRPSALEEVTFDGTVWDDFGVPAYGIGYSLAGGETTFVELGRDAAARERRMFGHLLSLEGLGAKPDDLVSWFAWAEDIGPDGKVRRTTGDLFFGEVRPFDEIFRERQNQGGEDEGQQGGQRGRRLAELQKQIISATWKLRRDGERPGYAADTKVVLDSQRQALAQAGEAAEEARGPREQALWRAVTQEMEKAITALEAAGKPAALDQALSAEQAAYQGLLRMQARETAVTRRGRQGGGGGGQGNQRQIDQLELQQSENRYETQRVARAPQNQERREQLAVMNRLQELARRQQDITDRLKELQTALQEARTETQREEIRKRLKRLEEEQRQLLADADEVRQRMERAENQAGMSQQRQQLDQTREDIQRAADAAAEGSVSQAVASGTRAQRQLQEMRDEMRKQNAGEFAEELREMRTEARDLAQRQEQAGRKLDELAAGGQPKRKALGDTGERQQLAEELAAQKERLNRLVDRATRLSEQAESTEPLLSRQLYDSIRKASQEDGSAVKQVRSELLNSGNLSRDLNNRLQRAQEREEGGRALDATRELLRDDLLPQARQVGRRAQAQVEELRRGVERAAESVLGDEAEQLKLARSELDSLTDQLQRESSQGGRGEDQRQAGQERRPGEGGKADETSPPGTGQSAGERGERAGREGQPGEALAEAGRQPGEGQPRPGEPGSPDQPRQASKGGQQPGGGAGSGQSGREPGLPGEARRGELADARTSREIQTGGGGRDRTGGLSVDLLTRGGDQRGGGLGGGEFGPVYRGPLTGDEFDRWTERLRDVEELVDTPEWRNALATARERARQIRRDWRVEMKKPDWAVVDLQIVKPLVEVRNRLAEELARRESKDSLAPIDRDPVPTRYTETVRRYYEELGKDK